MYNNTLILRQFRNRTMYCSLALVCQDYPFQSLFILYAFCFAKLNTLRCFM